MIKSQCNSSSSRRRRLTHDSNNYGQPNADSCLNESGSLSFLGIHISKISDYAFEGLQNTELNLRGIGIEEIGPHAFDKTKNLSIDLRNNNIQRISKDSFGTETFTSSGDCVDFDNFIVRFELYSSEISMLNAFGAESIDVTNFSSYGDYLESNYGIKTNGEYTCDDLVAMGQARDPIYQVCSLSLSLCLSLNPHT